MKYTPLADPFVVRFEKDGYEYEARVVYAKSNTSCTQFFDVTVTKPTGIEPFCLKEKAISSEDPDTMVWVDETEKQSIFYQLIGNEIAVQLREKVGVILLDTPVAHEESD